MNLSEDQASELLDQKKYVSYRFNVFDSAGQKFYGIKLSKADVESNQNQFVTLDDYNAPKGNNNGYYSYSYGYSYQKYAFKTPNGALYGYMRRESSETREFKEFLNLISQYPTCYQYYFADLEEGSKYIELVIFIDTKVFEKYYAANKVLTKNMISILQKYALNQYRIYTLKDCSKEREYDKVSPVFKLNLYDYQKQSLSWMINVENEAYKFLVPESSYYKLGDGAYIELINPTNQNNAVLSQYVFENDYQTNTMVRCRGGILADIMGNGKTVTTIALIFHNRPRIPPMLTSIIEREVYLPSRATLVVCPTNIATQWESEVKKCLGSNMGGLKVIKITTKTQMNKYSLSDILNADVVITTYNWLTHKSHIGTGFVKKNKFQEFLAAQKNHRIKYGDNYNMYPSYILHAIKYHRIIYDEFHEEINSKSKQNTTLYIIKNCLKATNIWGVSGTPLLENDTIMANIPNLLQIKDTFNNIYDLNVISQHEVFDRFVRRNEKQYLPPISYDVVPVQQTVQEKQLYDSSLSQATEILMQLCCYHNIHSLDIQNIDDVAEMQNKLRQEQREELLEVIEELENNLKQIEGVLRSMNPGLKKISELFYLVDSKHPKHTNKLVQQIQQNPTLQLQVSSLRQYRKFSRQLQTQKDELIELDKCIKYYEQTLGNLKVDGNFICPITGEPVGEGEVVITKDGHLFSKEAIEMLFEFGDGKYIDCPVTGEKLSRADITVVSNKKDDSSDLSSNERLFGSKISKVVDEINALKKGEKVIIFAEWDKLLHTIGYALDANDINHVYIKGSVSSRDKSIREFQKNPDIKCILLSAAFDASGVNLQQATNVFIVHPFRGDEGHHYEKQAIGRAWRTGQTKPVKVKFFITEKTIEQTLWDENRKSYYIS
jgi:SNF2 family DNA or RNA helicase